MAQVLRFDWPVPGGTLAAYAARAVAETGDRPVVVFLHGALRYAAMLEFWAGSLGEAADVVLLDLPGHGASPPQDDASLDAMADTVDSAIRLNLAGRRVLLVGESIGGTIALRIGGGPEGPVKAILAADPPLTTAKLWNVAASFRQAFEREPQNAFLRRFARDAFGLADDGVEERIYYPLLGRLRMPATILTGDIPLMPPRPVVGATSVFDAVDRFVADTFYPGKVEIEQIPDCGHLVLVQAHERCRQFLLRRLTDDL